jgi:DNA topoisomerase-3
MTRDTLREVINACDAGREGELIFRYTYDLAQCRAPVKRLWVSSMTDEAIRTAWAAIQPAARYDALGDAARCRSEADWLVGLNATRAMTCLARNQGMQALLSVGRVQTPTLSMIVERDLDIEDFTPQTFWQVKATFQATLAPNAPPNTPRDWEATWFQTPPEDPDAKAAEKAKADKAKADKAKAAPKAKGGDKDKKDKKDKDADEEVTPDDRVSDRATADAIVAAVTGRAATVSQAQRRKTTEPPPLLYDLTSLQRRANQLYNFSAAHTLEVAQALYEKHKLLTYPRTDACYITPDQVPLLEGILKTLGALPDYAPFTAPILAKPIKPTKRVVNAEEVGDHHALLPTDRRPKLDRISEDERKLYDLVARRLIAVLSPDALFDVTTLVVSVGKKADRLALPDAVEVPLKFRARGRICRLQGWRAVDPAPGKGKDLELPPVERGDTVQTTRARTHEGKTRPPSPFNDASILLSMETAGRQLEDAELKRTMRNSGLGTPATRAAVLQTLLDRNFIIRDGRYLRSTSGGRALIQAIPIDELKSAQLTAEWEARLSAMAEGRERRVDFIRDVSDHVRALTDRLRRAIIPAGSLPPTDYSDRPPLPIPDTDPLGPCPVCQTPVREGRAAFSCEKGRACQFVVFKTMAQRPITPEEVTTLLTQGQTPTLDGFQSKAGRAFSAALRWDPDQQKVTFAFTDSYSSSSSASASSAASSASASAHAPTSASTRDQASDAAQLAVGDRCPSCAQGEVIKGRAALGCSRWREGCAWRQPF